MVGFPGGGHPWTKDSAGTLFDPTSLAHTFTYNGSGQILTDTCVDDRGVTRVKTFTWTGSTLTSISKWVVQ